MNDISHDDFYLMPYREVNNPNTNFYLLYKNDKNFFLDFKNSLSQKNDINEFYSIIALMDFIDGNNLPPKKFKHIIGGKKDRKDIFEFKSKHLRVYVIKKEPDMYVVLGGFKKNQVKDISKIFRHFNNIPDKIKIKDDN